MIFPEIGNEVVGADLHRDEIRFFDRSDIAFLDGVQIRLMQGILRAVVREGPVRDLVIGVKQIPHFLRAESGIAIGVQFGAERVCELGVIRVLRREHIALIIRGGITVGVAVTKAGVDLVLAGKWVAAFGEHADGHSEHHRERKHETEDLHGGLFHSGIRSFDLFLHSLIADTINSTGV